MNKKTSASLDIPYNGEFIVGVDEAGRGALAGDVIAAAVILDPQQPIDNLDDSKKLSNKKREVLYREINAKALDVGIGRANVEEIEELNILNASMLAMKRAVKSLSTNIEYILVDGNKIPNWEYPSLAVINGDSIIPCISAASIVAKVYRDMEMCKLSNKYPSYGFEKHKGYPTRQHKEILLSCGITEFHRKTYYPVKKIIDKIC